MSEENEFDGMSIRDVAGIMQTVQLELDGATAIKADLQKRWDFLRYNVLPQMMEGEGIQNVTFPGIGRLSVAHDIRVSTPAANKGDAQKWLRDNEFGDLIKPTVNASSLKSLIRELMKEGKVVVPDDIFKIDPYSRASITRT